ncbi:Uma2 family endonuclease [Megalodesulfovibrio gigas]|nr:Uma2 family endonuclease [Megalodesulfovibrio gigas]
MPTVEPDAPESTARQHEHVRMALAGALTFALAGSPCRVLASPCVGPSVILANDAVCTLLDASEHGGVQPDLAVICEHEPRLPVLVVEVQTPDTLLRDTTRRLALYEALKVREYWIVDVMGQLVHGFALNHEEKYKLFQSAAPGETMESKILPHVSLPAWEGWLTKPNC